MDFEKLVHARYSARSYHGQAVEEEKVTSCLAAARRAPSACNAQPWHFVVVRDSAARARLGELSRLSASGMNRFVGEAPVVIAIVAEPPNITSRIGGFLKGKPFYLVDIGIAAEHLCLQATELGLGTCMIGWFDEKEVRALLGIPRGKRVALLVTLGYPAESLEKPRRRKSLSRVASRERYGESW
jgi:nitroreductase